MKLTITNFGPVKGKQNYTIDLSKDFTLVTGGNGLGKTYLGYIVYGLIKRINNNFLTTNPDGISGELERIKLIKEIPLSYDLTFDKVKVFTNKLIDSYKESIHIFMGIDKRTANMLFKDLSYDKKCQLF